MEIVTRAYTEDFAENRRIFVMEFSQELSIGCVQTSNPNFSVKLSVFKKQKVQQIAELRSFVVAFYNFIAI